ncbi:MAG: hypothetical protein ACRD2W_14895 [Acidimicrobiales bacterium]
MAVTYLDSSAIVKLAVAEPQSGLVTRLGATWLDERYNAVVGRPSIASG